MSRPGAGAQTDVEKMIAAMEDGRELVRDLHAAVKDARQVLRELREARAVAADAITETLAGDVIAAAITARIGPAVDAAADKVLAGFDAFGESLLGKDVYWRTAAGRRAAARPDGTGT